MLHKVANVSDGRSPRGKVAAYILVVVSLTLGLKGHLPNGSLTALQAVRKRVGSRAADVESATSCGLTALKHPILRNARGF